VSTRLCAPDHRVPIVADRFGGLAFERRAQCRPGAGDRSPGGIACRPRPSRPRTSAAPSARRASVLTLMACSRQTEIIDSMEFVKRSVRASGRYTEAQHRERLVQTLAQEAGRRPGTGAVEFFGRGEQGLPGSGDARYGRCWRIRRSTAASAPSRCSTSPSAWCCDTSRTAVARHLKPQPHHAIPAGEVVLAVSVGEARRTTRRRNSDDATAEASSRDGETRPSMRRPS
jgi:hypothetical protein